MSNERPRVIVVNRGDGHGCVIAIILFDHRLALV
jgi:hypothetical protein